MYSGKSQSLGIKVGGAVKNQWAELAVIKSPKIASVGHEGQHALLLGDDGAVYFVGTSKKGENGDVTGCMLLYQIVTSHIFFTFSDTNVISASKNRRAPKPLKAKKFTKMEGKPMTCIAENSGTSAMVTRDGRLYMFGKDTTYCDPNSGLVRDLQDVSVARVALGKSQAVALTTAGHIYTFFLCILARARLARTLLSTC